MTLPLPHLVLHLGHDKTGSTAIQRALWRSDADLQASGMYFPDPGKHANHQILMPALSGRLPDDPVQMQTLARSEKAAWKAANDSWRRLRARLDRGDIKRLIISSEIEFRRWSEDEVRHLSQSIDGIIGSIEVVAYLRPPASYMMSVVQQDLKKRPNFRPIARDRYRACLEPFLVQNPGPVRALAFDRNRLLGGDVVRDFVSRFLPGLSPDAIAARGEDDNESISAEAISILQGYFRDEVKAPHRWYDVRPQRFKRLVMAADETVPGFVKPRLKPGLAEMAVARASDLDWLQDKFDLDFHGDTGGVTPEAAERLFATLRDIEDVTEVRTDRRSGLLDEMARIASREQAPLRRLARVFQRQ